MALEAFFNDGNKIGVFGSIVYLPGSASDLDFTLFTQDGRFPFSSFPEYSKEIYDFFALKFNSKGLRLDFTGRRDSSANVPYDLSGLPKEDIRLEGYYLSGIFFPDRDFFR